MKISCNVIRDILPLYAEDMASQDTRDLVEDIQLLVKTAKNALKKCGLLKNRR